MIMGKGPRGEDRETMCPTFGSYHRGSECIDHGSSDEFNIKHRGRWPNMRIPD